ncbi:hypothetical protein WDW37_11870 [Bdellovibrionota bacterium FG-1]
MAVLTAFMVSSSVEAKSTKQILAEKQNAQSDQETIPLRKLRDELGAMKADKPNLRRLEEIRCEVREINGDSNEAVKLTTEIEDAIDEKRGEIAATGQTADCAKYKTQAGVADSDWETRVATTLPQVVHTLKEFICYASKAGAFKKYSKTPRGATLTLKTSTLDFDLEHDSIADESKSFVLKSVEMNGRKQKTKNIGESEKVAFEILAQLTHKVAEKIPQSTERTELDCNAISKTKKRQSLLANIPGEYGATVDGAKDQHLKIEKVSDTQYRVSARGTCLANSSSDRTVLSFSEQSVALNYSEPDRGFVSDLKNTGGCAMTMKFSQDRGEDEPISWEVAGASPGCCAGLLQLGGHKLSTEDVKALSQVEAEANKERDAFLRDAPGPYRDHNGHGFDLSMSSPTLVNIEYSHKEHGCSFKRDGLNLVMSEAYKGQGTVVIKDGKCTLNFRFANNWMNVDESGDCRVLCSSGGTHQGEYRKK